MRPSQSYQHLRQWTIVSAHTQTEQQRRAVHRIFQKQSADDCVRIIDDTFRERVMIVGDASQGTVGKGEILPLEREATAHATTERERTTG